MAALLAGLPVEVAGQTVNRLCGSGLQAVNAAAHAIGAGDGDVFIAGGVESMTRAPYVMLKAEGAWERGARTMEDTTLGWRFVNPRMQAGVSADLAGRDRRVRRRPVVGLPRAAGRVRAREPAARRGGDRGRAVRRPARPGRASPGRKGAVTVVDRDEHPRPDTSREALAALKPAFRTGGTVTAGNSSGHQRRRRRRCCSWRRSARASWACGRWPASSRRRSPASTPT